MSDMSIFDQLAAPFYGDEIEWKKQSVNKEKTRAMIVPYIKARGIMQRLDDVVGPMNWRDEYVPGPQGGVLCGISLRLGNEWVTKWDGAENTDVEEVKGGLSDAFKRAAVKWGIGRYLYNVPKMWFELNDKGYPKTEPTMPREFLPADADAAGNRPKTGKKQQQPSNGKTQAQAPTNSKPAQPTTPAPEKAPAKVEAPAPEPAPAPAPAAVAEAPVDPALMSDWAKRLVIPDNIGVPMAGKTLGEAMGHSMFGYAIMCYLSGDFANASGKFFKPTENEPHLLDLQKAAAHLLAEMPKPEKKKSSAKK